MSWQLFPLLLLLLIEVKPLNAKIISPPTPLVADRRYEVPCESVGSRPNAIITWYKGKRPLRRTKVNTTLPPPPTLNHTMRRLHKKHYSSFPASQTWLLLIKAKGKKSLPQLLDVLMDCYWRDRQIDLPFRQTTPGSMG